MKTSNKYSTIKIQNMQKIKYIFELFYVCIKIFFKFEKVRQKTYYVGSNI